METNSLCGLTLTMSSTNRFKSKYNKVVFKKIQKCPDRRLTNGWFPFGIGNEIHFILEVEDGDWEIKHNDLENQLLLLILQRPKGGLSIRGFRAKSNEHARLYCLEKGVRPQQLKLVIKDELMTPSKNNNFMKNHTTNPFPSHNHHCHKCCFVCCHFHLL